MPPDPQKQKPGAMGVASGLHTKLPRSNNSAKRDENPQHAPALAAIGLPVFPVRADKRPATKHGFRDAITDRNALRPLWRAHTERGGRDGE